MEEQNKLYLYNTLKGIKERIKKIYMDKGNFIVVSDIIHQKEETVPNLILEDRVLTIKKSNNSLFLVKEEVKITLDSPR